MFGELIPSHVLFVIIIAILVFGPRKLPELARSLGEGIREFKKAMNESVTEPKTEAEAVAKSE